MHQCFPVTNVRGVFIESTGKQLWINSDNYYIPVHVWEECHSNIKYNSANLCWIMYKMKKKTWVHCFISYGIPKECHIHVYENWTNWRNFRISECSDGFKEEDTWSKEVNRCWGWSYRVHGWSFLAQALCIR